MFVLVWVNHLNKKPSSIISVVWIYKADYPITRIHINIHYNREDVNIGRRDQVNDDRRITLRVRFYHMSVFSSTFHYILKCIRLCIRRGAHAQRKWTRFYFANTNLIKSVIKQYLVNMFFGSICVL